MEGYVWWRHKDVPMASSLVCGTCWQHRVIYLPLRVVSCFDIMLSMVCPSTVVLIAVVNSFWLNHAQKQSSLITAPTSPWSILVQTNNFSSHIAQAHPALGRCASTESVGYSCMESIPTIRAKQWRHVNTLIDKMRNTRKHHHPLFLKGVITSAKIYDVYLKHKEPMYTLHASYII